MNKRRDELQIACERIKFWINEMNLIIGYDNRDGFHSTPTPHDLAMRLVEERTQLRAALSACVEALERGIKHTPVLQTGYYNATRCKMEDALAAARPLLDVAAAETKGESKL